MKKRLVRYVSFVLALVMAGSFAVPAAAQEDELSLASPSVCLMESSTGRILYEKNSRDIRACASITKVMTLILTMEALDRGELHLDDVLTASAHASSMGGSDIWLREGEQMSVDDLIKATVVMSANDAAVVLAEAVAGSEEAFVARMNEKAQELGMADTVFKNCNGLDEEGHVTSACDVAEMSRELINYPKIFDYTGIWIDYVRDGQTQLVNTNKLIRNYKGITGLKTGTTSQAGSCISATAERDGMGLVAVVLGAPSTKERFGDAEALLNYGFANYAVIHPDFDIPETLPVKNGMTEEVKIKAGKSKGILVSLKDKGNIEVRVETEELTAPVDSGDSVGKVVFSLAGEDLAEVPVKAAGDVEKLTFGSVFRWIMSMAFFNANCE